MPDIVATWLTRANTLRIYLSLFVDENIDIESLLVKLKSLPNVISVVGDVHANQTKELSIATDNGKSVVLILENLKWF